MSVNTVIEFSGIVKRQIYESENYRMYSVEFDKDKYPNIKKTVYGTATIAGNLHPLILNQEYIIKAVEKNSPKGYSYLVNNIRAAELRTEGDVLSFLSEILTWDQAKVLYKEYPNIIDLVVSGKADEVVDLNKLPGIKEYRFACVKKKIIENYGLYDIINEFGGVLTISMCKSLYEKYPSIEKIRQEVKYHPYTTFCSLARVGFKTADSLILNMQKEGKVDFGYDVKTSKERCLACMMQILEENEESGSTRMPLLELKKQVMALVPACANHFVDCINNNDNLWYSKETMDIAIKSTYNTELNISNIIKSASKINNVWDIDWQKYQVQESGSLTDEQMMALKNVVDNQVSILCGFGGSGKSYSVITLIKMLKDYNKDYLMLAPSAKAAQVLKEYTHSDAQTIHMGLGYNPTEGWKYNNNHKLQKDIVIVDECSMCDIFLFLHLLEAIDFEKTKLLIIGDPEQIASVSAGRVLNDLINSSAVKYTMLNHIFRYTSGGIIRVATDTRNNKMFISSKDVNQNNIIKLGDDSDYTFIQADKDELVKKTVDLYKGLLSKGIKISDIMVIIPQNIGDYGTFAVNEKLQVIANPNFGKGNSMKLGKTTFFVGDYVMQTKNNYASRIAIVDNSDNNNIRYEAHESSKTLICNGESGIIKHIDKFFMIIDFGGKLIMYDRSELDGITLAYAISVHKSQGSSSEYVIFLCCSSHTYMLNSNLMYVGYTRAKKKLFNIGNISTINLCLKKKENLKRDTFLCDMLKSI